MQYLGITDTDLRNVSTNELMLYALANLNRECSEKEGGYAVRPSRFPVVDFGQPTNIHTMRKPFRNPLMAAYPILWPYGVGGIETERPIKISFKEHVRWALQYYDRRFRVHHSFPFVAFGIEQKRAALYSAKLQMKRKDFEADTFSIASLTVQDLQDAEKEESLNIPISDPRVKALRKHVFAASGRVMGSNSSRASYRGQIWGGILWLRPPTLWITINPSDLHDPVAQVFAGEEINMDQFVAHLGPDSNKRARNLAKDPYAATKYFHFIIKTLLETMYGIKVLQNRVVSNMGVLGRLSGYFGVIEAQGRGSLHVHMFLWLKNAPNGHEMKTFLKNSDFRERMTSYIKANIRAHVDGYDEEMTTTMPRETHLSYGRPPNPDGEDWKEKMKDLELRLVRLLQTHTCKRAMCLRPDKHGRMVCKRRAPWPLSNFTLVDEDGTVVIQRTHPFVNCYCPSPLVSLRCNNDIQALTNGEETRDSLWYSASYSTKNQGKSFNTSALMAKSLMYHEKNSAYLQDIRERNRLLIFRCFNILNQQMELSAQQVISYLMGWGDVICSHQYVSIYWSHLQHLLQISNPHMDEEETR